MIKTIDMLLREYSDYNNKYNKIVFEEKKNNIIKLRRGLYETDKYADPLRLANYISSPSYISYETALAYYGMIPERVYLIKSATYCKNKRKFYENFFGRFYYHDINKNAYPHGVVIEEIDGAKVQIASREKALLDLISKISPRRNEKEIQDLLFDDLRINEEIFDELDKKKMIELCDLYNSTSLKLLKKYILKHYSLDNQIKQ